MGSCRSSVDGMPSRASWSGRRPGKRARARVWRARVMARRMAQNGAPTHEFERQGRWKQGGGMVGRYTRGESAGSALRYL